MEFRLRTPTKDTPGCRLHCISFSMETVDRELRDNVVKMIVAALDGGTVGQTEAGELEERPAALGFHKEEEEEND